MRRRVEADCIDHKGNVRKITEIMIKNTNMVKQTRVYCAFISMSYSSLTTFLFFSPAGSWASFFVRAVHADKLLLSIIKKNQSNLVKVISV